MSENFHKSLDTDNNPTVILEQTINDLHTLGGYESLLLVINLFPKSLHNEMMEELALNILEWFQKLNSVDKDKFLIDIKNTFKDEQSQTFSKIRYDAQKVDEANSKILELEEKKLEYINYFFEFPSFNPVEDESTLKEIETQLFYWKSKHDTLSSLLEQRQSEIETRKDNPIFNLIN
jgi:hypothetical protein